MIGIPNKIYELRTERKMPQRELAKKSGLSRSTIADIENGNEDPRQSTMIAIAKALNLSVTEVFDLDWKK